MTTVSGRTDRIGVIGYGGQGSMTVTTTVATTNLLAFPGVLTSVLLATNAGGVITFYDNVAGDTSGNMVSYILASGTIGKFYNVNMPFGTGLTISQATGATTMTLFYTLA
jgi:hypothetical protein